jgi:RNA polymerase sigma-70 factor (ECF subfamily)
MIGVDEQEQAAPPPPMPPAADVPAPIADPVSQLSAVYRDYPGLRALILRRVHDPEIAADILQDAAVTTLEKLRSGEIAHPENLGGYLYRVAINHLRNHRRKDHSAQSSAEGLEELRDQDEGDPEWEHVGRPQWAAAARRMLEELPATRDRDLLVRFYLNDEAKDALCRELQLSSEHFNRVIFRARNRFRELLEQRGFWKSDLLGLALLGLCLGCAAAGGIAPAGHAAVGCHAATAAPPAIRDSNSGGVT